MELIGVGEHSCGDAYRSRGHGGANEKRRYKSSDAVGVSEIEHERRQNAQRERNDYATHRDDRRGAGVLDELLTVGLQPSLKQKQHRGHLG